MLLKRRIDSALRLKVFVMKRQRRMKASRLSAIVKEPLSWELDLLQAFDALLHNFVVLRLFNIARLEKDLKMARRNYAVSGIRRNGQLQFEIRDNDSS